MNKFNSHVEFIFKQTNKGLKITEYLESSITNCSEKNKETDPCQLNLLTHLAGLDFFISRLNGATKIIA